MFFMSGALSAIDKLATVTSTPRKTVIFLIILFAIFLDIFVIFDYLLDTLIDIKIP